MFAGTITRSQSRNPVASASGQSPQPSANQAQTNQDPPSSPVVQDTPSSPVIQAPPTTMSEPPQPRREVPPLAHPAFRGMPLPPCTIFGHAISDPLSWLRDYEQYADNYSCDDKVKMVRYYLDAESKQWYDTLDPAQLRTWDAFTKTFQERWDSVSAVSLHSRLSGMQQTVDMPVRSFITQFQHRARPLNMDDTQMMSMLYSKITPHLVPDIMRANPQSMNAFIQAAVKSEEIHKNSSHVLSGQVNSIESIIDRKFDSFMDRLQVQSLHAPDLAQPKHKSHHTRNNRHHNTQRNQAPNANRQFHPRPMVPNQQYRAYQRSNNWERPSYNSYSRTIQCFCCLGLGHKRSECPSKFIKCPKCNQSGHVGEACKGDRQ